MTSRVRKDARITQEKMSRDLLKSLITIKRWEKGEREPSFADVCAAVRIYELDIFRYTVDAQAASEICNRGFGKFIRYLEQGVFVDHDLLKSFNERDWNKAQSIHNEMLSTSMVNHLWSEYQSEEVRPLSYWGKNPSDAAETVYAFFEKDNWDGFLRNMVLQKLKTKFEPAFELQQKMPIKIAPI